MSMGKPGALLVLEDGTSFIGRAFGAQGETFGEAVFNTGMAGYQEVLTDPSYHGQIVAMTYPHVGNYGVNADDAESAAVRVSGFVVREATATHSNHRAQSSVQDYLTDAGVVGIEGIDTRRLTRHLRIRGAMRAGLSTVDLEPESLRARVLQQPSMEGLNLVDPVTTAESYRAQDVLGVTATGERTYRVAAYDFGIKYNILRLLAAHGCDVTVFPASAPADAIAAGGFDGVFLSNGPGDPAAVAQGIENTRALIGRLPVFGICLGHQILALALGATTYKLRFGHRGVNQPVQRLADGAVEITSHNHGFSVDADSLPARAHVTHVNLNDGTCEGVRVADAPAFSVQYHPEAAPGPHDARYLFDAFTELMDSD